MAVDSDEPVIGNSEVKKLEDRVRELERILGRKTLENEILREALPKPSKKTDIAADIVAEGRFPMKEVAEASRVSRSNLSERMKGKSKPRGPYLKADDVELLAAIRKLVDARPAYGCRGIAALLNRQRRAANQPSSTAIVANHAMILEKHTAVRKGRPRRQGHGDAVEPSLVLRGPGVHLLGIARWSASLSSSTHLIERSSRGRLSPMPGSSVLMSTI